MVDLLVAYLAVGKVVPLVLKMAGSLAGKTAIEKEGKRAAVLANPSVEMMVHQKVDMSVDKLVDKLVDKSVVNLVYCLVDQKVDLLPAEFCRLKAYIPNKTYLD